MDETNPKDDPGIEIGWAEMPNTFHLHTDMAEHILIDHDGTTYELVERGDGIALEEVPEDDG